MTRQELFIASPHGSTVHFSTNHAAPVIQPALLSSICSLTFISLLHTPLFELVTDPTLSFVPPFSLSQHERTRITERQHKREIHFANRKFVLKA